MYQRVQERKLKIYTSGDINIFPYLIKCFQPCIRWLSEQLFCNNSKHVLLCKPTQMGNGPGAMHFLQSRHLWKFHSVGNFDLLDISQQAWNCLLWVKQLWIKMWFSLRFVKICCTKETYKKVYSRRIISLMIALAWLLPYFFHLYAANYMDGMWKITAGMFRYLSFLKVLWIMMKSWESANWSWVWQCGRFWLDSTHWWLRSLVFVTLKFTSSLPGERNA